MNIMKNVVVCQDQCITPELKRKFEELCCYASLLKSCPSAGVTRSLRAAFSKHLYVSFRVSICETDDYKRLMDFVDVILLVARGALPLSALEQEIGELQADFPWRPTDV